MQPLKFRLPSENEHSAPCAWFLAVSVYMSSHHNKEWCRSQTYQTIHNKTIHMTIRSNLLISKVQFISQLVVRLHLIYMDIWFTECRSQLTTSRAILVAEGKLSIFHTLSCHLSCLTMHRKIRNMGKRLIGLKVVGWLK